MMQANCITQAITKEQYLYYYNYYYYYHSGGGGGGNSHIAWVGVCHWVCESPTLY